MSVEEWFEQRYLRAFMKDAIDEDRHGLHVTDFTNECPRKIYYTLQMRMRNPDWEKRHISPRLANIFWIGSRYHEIPMSNVVVQENGKILVINNFDSYDIRFEDDVFHVYDQNGMYIGVWGHEFPVEDRSLNVVGRIDELMFYDGELYVLDKKTTKKIPNEPYENYVNQVKIYASILHKFLNIDAQKGAILFIQKDPFELKSFVFDLGNLDSIYTWFAERVRTILDAVENYDLPPKKESMYCRWCDFREFCAKDIAVLPIDFNIKSVRLRQTTLNFGEIVKAGDKDDHSG